MQQLPTTYPPVWGPSAPCCRGRHPAPPADPRPEERAANFGSGPIDRGRTGPAVPVRHGQVRHGDHRSDHRSIPGFRLRRNVHGCRGPGCDREARRSTIRGQGGSAAVCVLSRSSASSALCGRSTPGGASLPRDSLLQVAVRVCVPAWHWSCCSNVRASSDPVAKRLLQGRRPR